MIKKDIKQEILLFVHKFMRFTKEQKGFALYILGLAFLLVFFPVIKVQPVADESYSVWILNGKFFTTMIIVYASLGILLGRNMSFKFKNMVIAYFGFKEHDALLNCTFLGIILTSFFAIGNTTNVVNEVTATIKVSGMYYFTWIYLVIGLIFMMMTVVKQAKHQAGKTKIINVVDQETLKDITNKKAIKGLFDHEHQQQDEE